MFSGESDYYLLLFAMVCALEYVFSEITVIKYQTVKIVSIDKKI